MNISLHRGILLAGLVIALAVAWLAPIDTAAEKAVDDGLSRALIGFGSATVVNGVLSVAESTNAGVVTFGKIVKPANDLVGKIADIMLAASIAFGVMKVLVTLSGSVWVSLVLTVLVLWGMANVWKDRAWPPLFPKLLLLVTFVRFAMPLAVVGSEAIFQGMLAKEYETAQKALSEIPGSNGSFSAAGKGQESGGISASVAKLKAQAEAIVRSVTANIRHFVQLATIALLQTVLFPLFLLWLFRRVGLVILDSTLRRQ